MPWLIGPALDLSRQRREIEMRRRFDAYLDLRRKQRAALAALASLVPQLQALFNLETAVDRLLSSPKPHGY